MDILVLEKSMHKVTVFQYQKAFKIHLTCCGPMETLKVVKSLTSLIWKCSPRDFCSLFCVDGILLMDDTAVVLWNFLLRLTLIFFSQTKH